MFDFMDLRRQKTIEALKKLELKVNKDLPLVEEDIKPQPINVIANRIDILHLFYTVGIEGEESKKFFFNILKEKGLINFLSETEKAILEKQELSKQDIIDFTWGKEAIYALMWCTQLVKIMNGSLNEVDIANLYKLIPPEKNKEDFLKSLNLRDKNELLQMVDYYYNLHWSIKHTQPINQNKLSIVKERRKALEWCVYGGNWDDVSLDT